MPKQNMLAGVVGISIIVILAATLILGLLIIGFVAGKYTAPKPLPYMACVSTAITKEGETKALITSCMSAATYADLAKQIQELSHD